MQITKIQYSKTVESQVMGAGVWVKIGVDANVSENENIAEAIEQAKQAVDGAHQKELTGKAPQGDLYFNETTRKYEP